MSSSSSDAARRPRRTRTFKRLPPIMFHHFHSEAHPAYASGSITADDLEQIIQFVGRENILDAHEYIQRRSDGSLLPHQTCITLDDGLQCQFQVALPVLQRHNIRAAWHVYTSVHTDRVLEQLEVYKYFQSKFYDSIEEFYREFFTAVELAYGEHIDVALTSATATAHASHAPFYSVSDRRFRYIRDVVLHPDQFFDIILSMAKVRGLTPDTLLDSLWISTEQVCELVRRGQLVGLHSYSHNRNMDTATFEVQQHEYCRNHEQLCAIVRADPALHDYLPICMAHPLGKLRTDVTTCVLDDLNIEIGFLAHDDGSPECEAPVYAVPRIDHSAILRTMKKHDEVKILPQLRNSAPAHAIPVSAVLDSHGQGEQRADVVCARALAAVGIRSSYGIPGVQNLALYRALAFVGGVKCVLVESELNSMAVAIGETLCTSDKSGKTPLACLNVIGGPGVTHALGGIALAAQKQVPSLVICTGVRCHPHRDFQLHDVRNDLILAPVCKAVFRVQNTEVLLDTIAAAAHIARSTPCGPVAVEIAADVLGMPLTHVSVQSHSDENVNRLVSTQYDLYARFNSIHTKVTAKASEEVVPKQIVTQFLALLQGAVGVTSGSLVVVNEVEEIRDACEWAFASLGTGLFQPPESCGLWCAIPVAVGAALRMADENDALTGRADSINGERNTCERSLKTALSRAIALTRVDSLDYTLLSSSIVEQYSGAHVMVCVFGDDCDCVNTDGISRTEAAARTVGALYVDAASDDPDIVYAALCAAALHEGVVFVRTSHAVDSAKDMHYGDRAAHDCDSQAHHLVIEHILASTGGCLFVGDKTKHEQMSVFFQSSADERVIVCQNDMGASFSALGASRIPRSSVKTNIGLPVLWLSGDNSYVQGASGIGEAFMDNVPILCIVAQVESQEIFPTATRCCAPLCVNYWDRCDNIRECASALTSAEPVTKKAHENDFISQFSHMRTVKHPSELQEAILEAVHAAYYLRGGGPALLTLSSSLFDKARELVHLKNVTDMKRNELQHWGIDGGNSSSGVKPSFLEKEFNQNMEDALLALRDAGRLLVYAGQGASHCTELLETLARQTGCMIATTWSGKGAISEHHRQWLWSGIGGALPSALYEVAKEAQACLIIGARLSEAATAHYRLQLPALTVHVDIDASVLQAVLNVPYPVCADAEVFLRRLCRQITEDNACEAVTHTDDVNDWHLRLRDAHTVVASQLDEQCGGSIPTPSFVAKHLQSRCDPGTFYFTDSGNGTPLFAERLRIDRPRMFHCPSDYSSMGYSVPAAVGAALASQQLTVALVGDGALMMTGGELRTAASRSAPLLVVVLRDGELGLMATLQRAMGEQEHCTKTLPYSVVGLAQLCTVQYFEVHQSCQLDRVLNSAINSARAGKPALVECSIDYMKQSFFTMELEYAAAIGYRNVTLRT